MKINTNKHMDNTRSALTAGPMHYMLITGYRRSSIVDLMNPLTVTTTTTTVTSISAAMVYQRMLTTSSWPSSDITGKC